MEKIYVPYKTLSEKREVVKDYLEMVGSICRKVGFDKVKYPSKRPGEKKMYAMLMCESLEYLRDVESDYPMSINTIQITYANGLTARVSVRFFETYITYFYDQDDYDHNTDYFDTTVVQNDPKCKRYELLELMEYLQKSIELYGGIYEIVFYISVWGRVYPDKPFPIKVYSIKDIAFIYSYKSDKIC